MNIINKEGNSSAAMPMSASQGRMTSMKFQQAY